MAITAATILTGVKPLLNDPQGIIYSDAALLPLLSKAYKELQARLSRAGMGVSKEVSAVVPVNTGVVALGDGSGLPSGFLYPIELKEAARGAPLKEFFLMTESSWEETTEMVAELQTWSWREEEIKFKGAMTNRDILIRFMKGLTEVTATTTPIVILNSELFLEARTASIAAAVLGENYTRAQVLNADAEQWYDVLVGTLVKRGQRIPTRRRRTRYRT